ncbi:unnamed protein product [Dicrocoelium dendriticum]|nr:unnamed protein product [Dicrocoelium dendriticum]
MVRRCGCADVVALTETWLSPSDMVSDLLVDFVSYRVDRPDHHTGGGALLLIKRQYSHWEAPFMMSNTNVQVVSCYLRMMGRLEIFICVYRSPSSTREEDKELGALLRRAVVAAPNFLIVGDLNLPHADWQGTANRADTLEQELVDWMHENALEQYINIPTRSRIGSAPSTLDVAITKHGRFAELQVEAPLGRSDHCVLTFCLNTLKPARHPRLVRNFSRIDHMKLRDRALQVNWIPDQEQASLEQRWSVLKTGLVQLLNEFAPLRPARHFSKPRWWRRRIDRALKRRNEKWKKFNEARGFRRWLQYTKSRNKAIKMQRQAKYSYELRLARYAKTNPKCYYGYVQSKASLREDVGCLIMEDGSQAVEARDKAEMLLRVFQNLHRSDNGCAAPSQPHCVSSYIMQDIVLTAQEVFTVMTNLNPFKSAGPDDVHPAIVKPLADILQHPVLELFNLSLQECKLPRDWKEAAIVAIHKGGSKSEPLNYRPISLTCVLLKCLEKLIRNRICEHLAEHSLLRAEQHGFIKKKSCLTNLLCFLDEITRCLDDGIPVEVCYLDFSKAFDSVNHRFLLEKLAWFGVHPRLLSWVSEFLYGRTFRVRIGDVSSSVGVAYSGVPQGSVLGPLLFLMFINDLAPLIEDPCYIFADDLKLVSRGNRATLAKDIVSVVNWSKQWDLPLNASKCQILTTSRDVLAVQTSFGPFPLQCTTQARDLGVIMTSSFKPSMQCRYAANKARRELFRLRRALCNTKPEVFLPLYKAVVRPHLEYCVQAWSPYLRGDVLCLEKIQRLATRMVEGQRGKPYEDRLKSLGLFSLERRRLRGDLIETFKIMKGLSAIVPSDLFELADSERLRGHRLKLKQQRARLNVRAKFFSNRVVRNWNKLPSELMDCETVVAFKAGLDRCWPRIFPELI